MLVAPIVRHVSAELNQSLGTQFCPFSLAHCRTPAMPGCDVAGKLRFAARVAREVSERRGSGAIEPRRWTRARIGGPAFRRPALLDGVRGVLLARDAADATARGSEVLTFAFAVAGLVAAMRAARRRDRFLAASLNDRDEALVFVALSRLLGGLLLF